MAKYVAKEPVIIETWRLGDNEPRPPWVNDEAYQMFVNYSRIPGFHNNLYIVREGEDDEHPIFMNEIYLNQHYELLNEEKEA